MKQGMFRLVMGVWADKKGWTAMLSTIPGLPKKKDSLGNIMVDNAAPESRRKDISVSP
ncbi:hypothetical protein [Pedobacter gandavensis]|uniref:hypothetical protein n=1 Tax=Pedobacter gandavensis TaxID=2679963 RepID=UPI0015FF466B|nr:hypothetical protein [Pedobacter gandavensis]